MDFLRLLAAGRNAVLDGVFSALTYLGSEVVFLAAALLIFWCIDKRQGYYVFLVGAVGTVCNQFLKLAFRVPRPWVLDPEFQIVESARAGATGYSFPSGHTQNIVGTTAAIFASRKEAWVRVVCVVLMVLVPFSRMYLGVHTPLDVGVAFVLAIALAAALYPAFRTEAAAKRSTPWLLAGVSVLCAGYLLYASGLAGCDWPAGSEDHASIMNGQKNAYSLLGALLGFLIVYFVDEKKLHFDVRAPFFGQVCKLLLGLALTLGIKSGLKPLLRLVFGGSQAESAVRYFLLVLFAGIVWPLTFPFFARLGKKDTAV